MNRKRGERMEKRAIAEKRIREIEENVLRNLPVSPTTYTYIELFRVLQELQFQHNYDLAIGICDIWEKISEQQAQDDNADIPDC